MSSRTAHSPWPLWFLAGGLAGVGLAWLSLSHPSSWTRSNENLERELRERVRALLGTNPCAGETTVSPAWSAG